MGLALEVGMLAHLKDHDQEGFQNIGDDFQRVAAYLITEGLAPHDEPLELGELQGYSCDMHGYSGLHHLRRFAAYQALKQTIPEPISSENLDEEPMVEAYYDALLGGRSSGLSTLNVS